MYPILISLGSVEIPSWHFMYAVGALSAFALFNWLCGRIEPPVPNLEISRIFAVCYISGYFGARLLSILVEEPKIDGLSTVLAELTRFGSMTFYGGALASGAFGAVYARYRGLPVPKLFDCAIPAGLLALSFGRIGCFLNGDDFGTPIRISEAGTTPIWAVTFPNLGDGIARYPVQLVESGFALALAVSLVVAVIRNSKKIPSGLIAVTGAFSYAIIRFNLEFYRDDPRGNVLGTTLSTSQGISLGLSLACLGYAAAKFIPHATRLRSK